MSKVTDLISRISDIFGKATSDAMLPIFYGGSDFHIDGFVGKPLLSRSSNKHQYFFVNGRPIQHFALANSIKRAFHSMLMEGKKPVFMINIKIDPALIDVNVHPRKLEIRFEDQQRIIKIVYGCVKAALEKTSLIPKGVTESGRYMADGISVGGVTDNVKKHRTGNSSFGSPGSTQDAIDFSKNLLSGRDSQGLDSETVDESMIAVSQVSNSYIVAKNEDGLVLIDQHAAHERVRYEQLMDQFENQKKSIQPLLVPLNIEFSSDEMLLIKEHIEIFKNLGFSLNSISENSYTVSEVPGFLSNEDVDHVVKGVLDDILNHKAPSKFQGRTEEIITYMSCRSAIKFGQKLSLDEMQSLIKQLDQLKRPYTCPHGRPTMVSLTLGELEKMFGRK